MRDEKFRNRCNLAMHLIGAADNHWWGDAHQRWRTCRCNCNDATMSKLAAHSRRLIKSCTRKVRRDPYLICLVNKWGQRDKWVQQLLCSDTGVCLVDSHNT